MSMHTTWTEPNGDDEDFGPMELEDLKGAMQSTIRRTFDLIAF